MFTKISSRALWIYWKYRHWFAPGWGASYLQKIGHPVTSFVADCVLSLAPISTVLEFGASSGPNLIALKKRNEGLRCLGLDISPDAVRAGQEYMAANAIEGIVLRLGDEKELAKILPETFDAVFSAAVLIYLDEASVRRAVLSMLKIARKGVVIIEQSSTSGKSVFDGRKWLHDYAQIFRDVAVDCRVNSKRIPETVWPGDWGKRGYVYTLTKGSRPQ